MRYLFAGQRRLARLAHAAPLALVGVVDDRWVVALLLEPAHLGDRLFDLVPQLGCVLDQAAPAGAVVVDVAVIQLHAVDLLITNGECAQLHPVALVLTEVALFKLGDDPLAVFADNLVNHPADAQAVAPHPHAFARAYRALVERRAFGHVVVRHGVPQKLLDVVAARAKNDRVDFADGEIFQGQTSVVRIWRSRLAASVDDGVPTSFQRGSAV